MKDKTLLVIDRFKQAGESDRNQKERIVARLLENGSVTASEAALLLTTQVINLNAERLDVSSGAKILGGSDFSYEETHL